jgi:hypothetical protein
MSLSPLPRRVRFAPAAFALLIAAFCTPLRAAGEEGAASQRSFASPAEAVNALKDATKEGDRAAVEAIFGPEAKELLSGDPRQDAIEFARFAGAIGQLSQLVRKGDDAYTVVIGSQFWPFPIPIVRRNGRWIFDMEAGKEEILNRRIGSDELTAIGVCRAYVQAQREYAGEDRDGSGVLKYALRIKSAPGKRDGLYWPASPNEDPSPFGPLVAEARAEGYGPNPAGGQPQPFHGYLFKILTAQGPHAPGGAYDYVINGNLIAGFAMVAYPAHWGESGIMTFIVNQWGTVYERNLGQDSAVAGAAMTEFDPDGGWSPVRSR